MDSTVQIPITANTWTLVDSGYAVRIAGYNAPWSKI